MATFFGVELEEEGFEHEGWEVSEGFWAVSCGGKAAIGLVPVAAFPPHTKLPNASLIPPIPHVQTPNHPRH